MPATIVTSRVSNARSTGGSAPSAPLGPWRTAVQDALFPFLADAWLAEQRTFLRCLATLLRAGLPLHQALGTLLETARSERLRRVLTDASRTVAHGAPLSESFARQRDVFTEIQVHLLRAAEHGGFMERTLDRLAGMAERELELRRFIGRQTLYAKTFLVFAVLVIPLCFALLFGQNPAAVLVRVSLDFLQLAAVTALVFSAGRAALASSLAAREAYEIAKWKLPGIGPVARTYALARFGHALSGLYEAGIPLAASLTGAGRASGSIQIGLAAEQAALAAERGESVLLPLHAARLFPDETLNLLETGLTTGEVDLLAARAAAELEERAEVTAQKAAYLYSTAFFLFVALTATSLLGRLVGNLSRLLPIPRL